MQARQVAISRVLIGSISGLLIGAAASGLLADLTGWRGVFVAAGCVMIGAFTGTVFGLRDVVSPRAEWIDFAAVFANYRQVFSNPRAKVCYGAVFAEGAVLFGIFPYVAYLLGLTGEPRAGIAGFVIGGFAIGGLLYSAAIKRLLALFGSGRIMILGGAVAGVSLVVEAMLPPWPVQLAAMVAMGFGFFLIHGSFQVVTSEILPEARAGAVSLQAFCFFCGQFTGPLLYGFGILHAGKIPTLFAAAALLLVIGVACPLLLRQPVDNDSASGT